jgi:hypothetical protein
MSADTGEIIVTHHAATRYCERIDPTLTIAGAEAAIRTHARAIGVAASFGCPCIKTGDGVRLLLKGRVVATVLTADQWPPLPSRVWA